MKISKEVLEDILFEYSYEDWAKVSTDSNGKVILTIDIEESHRCTFDVIFAVSGIVQNTFDECNRDDDTYTYSDMDNTIFEMKDNTIVITFPHIFVE